MSTGTQIALGVVIAVVLFGVVMAARRRQPRAPRLAPNGEPLVTDPELLGDEKLGQVRRLAAEGRKIQAIKVVRDHVDIPLKEAKIFVESLDLTGVPPRLPVTELPEETLARVYQLKAAGKPIEAIRLVRQQTRWGLKDAKDYVDRL